MSPSRTIALAGFLMMLAIALGAFGAHALEGRLTLERLDTWQIAVRYQVWNSLGIIAMVLVGKHFMVDTKAMGLSLIFGIVIFSGSLYTLCLTNIGIFGAITPIGGLLMIIAWGLFAWKLFINTSES
ncbi:MAG: DUF423 domain-containing protein [Balneola sp.]|nr:MAG: DUF423 domain-containing protein [Balneola sp.]